MRTKYNDIDKANLAYRKQRKHTNKQTRKMIMRLLALLGKILGEIRRQRRVHPDEELLNAKQLDMLDTDGQERGEECNQAGTCQSESDRDHADLLRYPHCKCGQPCKTRVSPSISCSLMFHAWNAALREWWLQM